jgi:hypothetical protein
VERYEGGQNQNIFVISEKKGSRNYFYADSDGILQFGERDPNSK